MKVNNAPTLPTIHFSKDVNVNDVTVNVVGDIVISAQVFVIEAAQITGMVTGVVNPLNNSFKLDITQPGICMMGHNTHEYRLLILFDYFEAKLNARLDVFIGNQVWITGIPVTLWKHKTQKGE